MDNELKLSKHVEAQVCKANRILGLIRSYQYLDNETMRLLFTALVRPHFEFGNVWSPRFQKDKKLIERCAEESDKISSWSVNCYVNLTETVTTGRG